MKTKLLNAAKKVVGSKELTRDISVGKAVAADAGSLCTR